MVNRVLPRPASVSTRADVELSIDRVRPPIAAHRATERSVPGRQRKLQSLVRLDDAAETGPGFGKTFVNDCQQRSRRERLAQATRGAEFERHAQKVRRRRVEVGKGVSRHRHQRHRWRTLVEYPDRFEAAHVRHEDVDQHEIEAGVFQRAKPGFAAIGYRHVEAVTLKIDLDGRADHWIVIDDKNASHVSPRKQITYLQSNYSSVAIIMGLSGFSGGRCRWLPPPRQDRRSRERRMASPLTV